MATPDLKRNIHDYVDNADERLLKLIKALVETYEEDKLSAPVAYTIDGKPLSLEQYHQELAEAEEEIERGEFITQEDLEKESEEW